MYLCASFLICEDVEYMDYLFMEMFMKIVKVGALAVAMMVALGCTVEAKTTYNPIKLIRKFDNQVLQPRMDFYRRGSQYVADQVQKVLGQRVAGAVTAGLMLPYEYPTATIITTIAVITASVVAYKKYTAKKKIEAEEENETVEII